MIRVDGSSQSILLASLFLTSFKTLLERLRTSPSEIISGLPNHSLPTSWYASEFFQLETSDLLAGLSYYKVIHLTNTWQTPTTFWGFPYNSNGKESGCNARDLGSVPGLGRSPGEGNGYLFQYSCLENPMDRGAWQTTVHGVIEESDTT